MCVLFKIFATWEVKEGRSLLSYRHVDLADDRRRPLAHSLFGHAFLPSLLRHLKNVLFATAALFVFVFVADPGHAPLLLFHRVANIGLTVSYQV